MVFSTLSLSIPSAPGGIGVDVKHDSYARYLARKKTPNLLTQANSVKAKKGNKTKKYGMIPECPCSCCQNLEFLVTINPPNTGDSVIGNNSGATGVVADVILGGEFPHIIVSVDDCDEPFTQADNGGFVIGGNPYDEGVIVGGINIDCKD